MRKIPQFLITAFLVFYHTLAFCQSSEISIDVGTHDLHFYVSPGNGTPIIFESGGGNDGTVWKEVIALLRQQTDAPLIAYDRAGFGTSGIDTTCVNITSEVEDLQTALQQLTTSRDYFLVAHSLGGNYAMKFISNAPERVKGAVFIDVVSPCFMTEQRATATKQLFMDSLAVIKKESIGFYHLVLNYENTSKVMREVAGSIETPLTVIASGKTPFEGTDREQFLNGLKRFAEDKKNRRYVLVEDADHYVFYDELQLVVDEIIRLYNRVH